MIYTGIPKQRSAEPEFQHQAALFTWARNPAVLAQYPALDLLSCSLNGVKLTAAQAGKAKAAGMLKGEFDIKLPVARGGHIGLIVEMKAGKNKPTPEQAWYGKRMADEGHRVAVCWSWEAAKEEIESYLSGKSGSIPTPVGANRV
jgi:hypothetical protein